MYVTHHVARLFRPFLHLIFRASKHSESSSWVPQGPKSGSRAANKGIRERKMLEKVKFVLSSSEVQGEAVESRRSTRKRSTGAQTRRWSRMQNSHNLRGPEIAGMAKLQELAGNVHCTFSPPSTSLSLVVHLLRHRKL